ncbi:armadillo-type fold-containing protein [Calothrix sp. NIES-3974]|uniref:armadillo-type fold-containing protein n=1 Tax=Calothrix sp. NIES-3974 TaxID=2005462 RepID=UPI000B5EC1CD|nr:armadillo-type fold-containing protein [Calothrix sp. NIES-3974]BAZ04557.1 hypothetical protein NIES3974_11970 [Calothrix sp. NIES-3974]
MAQASSSWRQITKYIPNWKLNTSKGGVKNRSYPIKLLKRFQGPGGSLGLVTFIVAMGVWDWKLLLALGVGLGTMVFAYSLQEWQWQKFWLEIRKFIYSPNRRILVAVLSGGIGTVSCYAGVSTWLELNHHWAATAMIIQGLASILILILLIWQLANTYGRDADHKVDEILQNLTASDPLKRLVAIRQVTKLVERMQVDGDTRQTIIDCLHLLLTQERETVVRETALTSLEIIAPVSDSPNSPTPLKPLKIPHKQQISL